MLRKYNFNLNMSLLCSVPYVKTKTYSTPLLSIQIYVMCSRSFLYSSDVAPVGHVYLLNFPKMHLFQFPSNRVLSLHDLYLWKQSLKGFITWEMEVVINDALMVLCLKLYKLTPVTCHHFSCFPMLYVVTHYLTVPPNVFVVDHKIHILKQHVTCN